MMPDMNATSLPPLSQDIVKIIKDSQKLIAYIAKDGDSELIPEVTEVIIQAKYKMEEGQWTADDEKVFLINYDKLAKIVFPVTVESLNSIIPTYKGKKRLKTKAERAVSTYRRYTLGSLILLLLCQIYWLCGHELRDNLETMISERELIYIQLENNKLEPSERKLLQSNSALINQRLDANYKLLTLWNKAWSFGVPFDDTMPPYFLAEYTTKKSNLEINPRKNREALQSLALTKTLHQVRMVLFENTLSANFILNTFQGYLLPLMYGLLGALIYVLRTLMKEIKNMTYAPNSEINFRLKITLGALGGMIVGWFLKPEDANAIASLSPMALAFIIGYNVDMLFSIMDKAIDNIRKSIDGAAKK